MRKEGKRKGGKIRDISREQERREENFTFTFPKSHITLKMKIFSFSLAFYYTPGICSVYLRTFSISLSLLLYVYKCMYTIRRGYEEEKFKEKMMEGKETENIKKNEKRSGM